MKHSFMKLTALLTLVALTGVAYAQFGKVVYFTFYSDYAHTKVIGHKTVDQCHYYVPTTTEDSGPHSSYVTTRSEWPTDCLSD